MYNLAGARFESQTSRFRDERVALDLQAGLDEFDLKSGKAANLITKRINNEWALGSRKNVPTSIPF